MRHRISFIPVPSVIFFSFLFFSCSLFKFELFVIFFSSPQINHGATLKIKIKGTVLQILLRSFLNNQRKCRTMKYVTIFKSAIHICHTGLEIWNMFVHLSLYPFRIYVQKVCLLPDVTLLINMNPYPRIKTLISMCVYIPFRWRNQDNAHFYRSCHENHKSLLKAQINYPLDQGCKTPCILWSHHHHGYH